MKKFLALAIVVVMTVALLAVGVQAADDFPYAHFVADGNDPCTGVTFSGAHTTMDPDAVKWATIKYRTVSEKDSGGAALTGQIYVQPAQEPCVPINYVHSQNWETLVLDLSGCSAWNSAKYTQTSSFRFDFLQGNNVQKGDSIDIAWIAFFENEADARAYDGTQDTPYCVSAPSDLAAKAGTNALQSVEVIGGADEGAKIANQNFDAINLTGPDCQIYGWFVLEGDTIADVGYRVDNNAPVFSSLFERADVQAYFGLDRSVANGFDVQFNLNDIPAGERVIHVVVKTEGGKLLDVNKPGEDGFKVVGTGAYVKQTNFDAVNVTGPDCQIYGWFIIEGDTIADVGYRVDDEAPVFSSLFERADVQAYFGLERSVANGFDVRFSTNDLSEGEHTVHVVVKTESGKLFDVNPADSDGFSVTGTKPASQTNPPSGDAVTVAVAAVGCIALAGVVVAKKVR